MAMKGGKMRRKVDPFLVDKNLEIDYKRPDILCRFISERGKIIPSRISGVTAKNQRKLALAIKRRTGRDKSTWCQRGLTTHESTAGSVLQGATCGTDRT